MFSALIGSRDQLSLSNAHLYLAQPTLDAFIYFANNVIVKQDLSYSEELSLERANEEIIKACTVFGIKLITPLRTLALRVLEGNLGFIDLHTSFLKVCKIFNTPTDALPILEYPGMFKHMRRSEQVEFLVQACDACLQLRKFPQAYDFALRAVRTESIKEERSVSAIKQLIVLSLYMRKSVKDYEEVANRLYNHYQQNLTTGLTALAIPKREEELQRRKFELAILNFYLTLREWRPLKEEEERILSHDYLLEAFHESQYAPLRTYIESEIKGLNWRIKAESIKNVSVGKLEVAHGINQPKEIYKYDSQEKIMYFNHKACDQEQLNRLISRAFLLQNETNNCKIERTKDPEFTRGLGALGGFGGLGLGGFGGFAGVGGGRRRREFGGREEFDFEQ